MWLGVIGIGFAILLFVVLGNPSAGGAYAVLGIAFTYLGTRPRLPKILAVGSKDD